uniref:CRAL-TRIO domain-containing protein n=1 Tax=Ciona savignyi TaxID=51511 RepID=H2ZHQ2_CIOSA
KAVKELNEPRDNELRLKAIDELRNSFDVKKYGPLISDDDGFILRFLRARKFDIKRALQVLQNYHAIRKDFRECFELVENPSRLKHVMDTGIMYAAEGKVASGESVIIYRPAVVSQEVKVHELLAYGVLCAEELLKDEEYQICGSITVDDLSKFNLRILAQFSLYGAKRMNQVWQDAMPIRMKTIYILNEGRLFDCIFALMRPFMKAKTKSRLRVCGNDYKLMHDEIPKTMLPPCLGGTGSSFDDSCKAWVEKL